jgi:hypothetical protein
MPADAGRALADARPDDRSGAHLSGR